MNPPDAIEPEGLFDGLSVGAIFFGALVDIGATLVSGLVLLLVFAPEVMSADPAEADAAIQALYASTAFNALELAVGLACTGLGAFVGALRAGLLHVRHGGWIAVTSTALFAFFALAQPPEASVPSAPFWREALGWILILPAGVVGGLLARAVQTRSPGQTTGAGGV